MFLIIKNWIHIKNEEGLIRMLNYLNWEYKIGTIDDINDENEKLKKVKNKSYGITR